jgi:RNAse (barnase) inhibitor barstar
MLRRMTVIEIDLAGCRTTGELHARLLAALDAPGWHGHGLDALWDGITGDLLGVRPPYRVEARGHESLPPEVLARLLRIGSTFEEARDATCLAVGFRLV